MFAQVASSAMKPVHGHFGLNSNGLSSPHDMSKANNDLRVSNAFGYILDVLDGDLCETEQIKGRADSSEQSPKAGRSSLGTSSTLEILNNIDANVQSLFPSDLILSTASNYEDDKDHTCRFVEDVSTKIITFTSQGPWAVFILSANGSIFNATLRHAGLSGGAVTYEGRFEILSLSGSFLLTENAGMRSRTGGLSVSLAGPDGRVIREVGLLVS